MEKKSLALKTSIFGTTWIFTSMYRYSMIEIFNRDEAFFFKKIFFFREKKERARFTVGTRSNQSIIWAEKETPIGFYHAVNGSQKRR